MNVAFDGYGEELRGDQSVQLLRHHWICGLVGKDRRIGEQAFGTVREMGVEAGDEVLWSCLGFGVAGGEREQKECGGEQRDEFQVAVSSGEHGRTSIAVLLELDAGSGIV